jgi:glycosyltransferase involved in cell wall biosynthesis
MSEPLAVAVDATPLLGVRTGVGKVVAEVLDALNRVSSAPQVVPYTLSWRARRLHADVPLGTRFVPIPARVLLPAWAHAEVPRIDRWLRPARVVHATNFLTPPSRLPALVTIHDCSFVRFPELCKPEVRAMVPIVRRAVRRGATLQTSSEFSAAEVEEIFGGGLREAGRLVVIPFGVPDLGPAAVMPERVKDALNGAPFVLALGTLEPRKNIALLVTAFGLVASKEPDVHLVIAGPDGPARSDVDAAVDRLPAGIASRVHLTGAVDEPGRRALLEAATVLAYPSHYEGFGFPALEAMSVGVPVVAGHAGALPEVVGDAALLVDPNDVAQLADAIARLTTDDSLRRDLVARGRDRVRDFSWDDTARSLTACYRRLANSSLVGP